LSVKANPISSCSQLAFDVAAVPSTFELWRSIARADGFTKRSSATRMRGVRKAPRAIASRGGSLRQARTRDFAGRFAFGVAVSAGSFAPLPRFGYSRRNRPILGATA
jgi:hypothetical protein